MRFIVRYKTNDSVNMVNMVTDTEIFEYMTTLKITISFLLN